MTAVREVAGTTVRVVQGDVATQDVDAIVNAANEYLKHGAGVAGAIVRAGGYSIQDESDRWVETNGPLGDGTAAVTGAGRLPARFVVHIVGPRYRTGQDNEALLRRAIAAALDAASNAGAASLALPAVSTGIFGYPLPAATRVIATKVCAWLNANPGRISEVWLVGYDQEAAEAFGSGLADA